jgi:hypothetical protein
LSEDCKAHEKELADMNAANAVLKAQLEKALADVKDLQQQAVDVRSLLIRYNHRIKQMKDKLSEVS